MARWTNRKRKSLSQSLTKAYASRRRVLDADGEWLALSEAAKYLNRPKCTLLRWKRFCAALGRGVQVRRFTDGLGRQADYLSKADLDGAARSQASLPSCPDNFISLNEACDIVGVTQNTLRGLLNRAIGKQPRVRGKRKDGRVSQRVLLPRGVVERLAEERRQAQARHTETLSVTEAASLLGQSRDYMYGLIERGILNPSRNLLVGRNGYVRRGIRLRRADVEAVAIRLAKTEGASVDEDGTWLPLQLAIRRYPNATSKVLYKYAGKPCPQLGGRVLRVRRFQVDTVRQHYWRGAVTKWLEADLRDLCKPVVGKPGQLMVASLQGNETGAAATPIHSSAGAATMPSAADDQAEGAEPRKTGAPEQSWGVHFLKPQPFYLVPDPNGAVPTPEAAPNGDQVPPDLKPVDLEILKVLDGAPCAQNLTQLEASLSCRKTLGPRCRALAGLGLIRQPHGKRGGYVITDQGRAALKNLATSH